MDLQVIILSELRKRKTTSYDVTYMRNLKTDTNELIYKRETDSQMFKTNLWLPRGKERGWIIRSLGLTNTNYYT